MHQNGRELRTIGMESGKTKIFEAIEPSRDLSRRVFFAIGREEERFARRKRTVSLAWTIASAVALMFACTRLFLDATHSGFAEALSLAFSDSATVAAYWTDFMLSISETLPYMSLVALLASVFAVMLSLRSLMRWQSYHKNYKNHHTAYAG